MQDDSKRPRATARRANSQKRAQAAMDKSLMQGRKRMNKIKQAIGLSIKYEETQVAVTFYLLRPQEAELEPEQFELGESITIFSQKIWKVAMLTSR